MDSFYSFVDKYKAAVAVLVAALLAILLFLMLGPRTVRSRGGIFSTEGFMLEPEWTSEELHGALVRRELKQTAQTTVQIIRLSQTEKPHIHDMYDVTVFVLKGEFLMHLLKQSHAVKTGDVIEIPRGTEHWAEIIKGPVEIYALFNPPFDAKDYRLAETA